MMGKTHVAIGLLTATFAGTMVRWPGLGSGLFPFAGSMAAVVLGSLAPDLDQPGSTLTREVAGPFGSSRIAAMLGGAVALYLSGKVNVKIMGFNLSSALSLIGIILLVMAFFKHRGVTHSLLGVLAAWYAVTALQNLGFYQHYIGIAIVKPFMIGYIAHIVADFFSGGIAPMYPVIEKRIEPPYSISTGSLLDKIVIRYLALFLAIVRIFNVSGPLLNVISRKG